MAKERERDRRALDFEDIRSDSGGAPRRPDFIREREERQPASRDWDIPQWENVPRRRTSYDEELDRLAEEYQRPETYREVPPEPRRGRRGLGSGARRGIAALLVLLMVAVTALLAILLVFKIGTIQVTGDPIEGVTDQEIIDLCGYQIGDNLIFLGTKEQESRLTREIPLIRQAEIRRRLPTTLEIRLTAAVPSAAIASGGQWFLVSQEGKILEVADLPGEDTVKVLGLDPLDREPGDALRLEDEAARTAFETILAAIPTALEEAGLPGRFTILDMTDLSAISLYYEDRVEFRLGNVLGLEYKIMAGCRFLSDPAAGDNGVMDLTATPESKGGVFTAGTITLPELPITEAVREQAAEPEEAAPSPSATPAPRTEGIPQTAYDGQATPTPESTPEPDGQWEDNAWEDGDWEETWDEPEEAWEDPQEDWSWEGDDGGDG